MRHLIYILIFILPGITSYSQKTKDLSDSVYFLSEFLVSPKFDSLSKGKSDLSKIDILYQEALVYNNFNFSETLLSLTFATLSFNEMKLNIPLLNINFIVPLPAPDNDLFKKKNNFTPRYLFFDSPKTKTGDIDKVAHFFGNAFLSFNISWIHFSDFLGLFVESFENEFKIMGSFDRRDLLVNKLGSEFGSALNDNPKLMPSQLLIYYDLLYFDFNSI